MAHKLKIASTSLAGCFGCHMSLLDCDEKIIELLQQVELSRSPLCDIKQVADCDIGIIEGAVANSENVEVIRQFRAQCKTLVVLGACALNGGIPALRNQYSLAECLQESYIDGMGLENQLIPQDEDLPEILDQVYPVQQLVKVDYALPGCPPRADMIWQCLSALVAGQQPELSSELIRYD